MTSEQVAAVALGMAEVTEERPFGPDTDVYKVRGKVFIIASPREDPLTVTSTCEPSLAVHLHERRSAVTPGYQVVAAFPKATRARLLGD